MSLSQSYVIVIDLSPIIFAQRDLIPIPAKIKVKANPDRRVIPYIAKSVQILLFPLCIISCRVLNIIFALNQNESLICQQSMQKYNKSSRILLCKWSYDSQQIFNIEISYICIDLLFFIFVFVFQTVLSSFYVSLSNLYFGLKFAFKTLYDSIIKRYIHKSNIHNYDQKNQQTKLKLFNFVVHLDSNGQRPLQGLNQKIFYVIGQLVHSMWLPEKFYLKNSGGGTISNTVLDAVFISIHAAKKEEK
ncbi:hypothetical protein pb186bvf_020015 [Paramecium bursaria]